MLDFVHNVTYSDFLQNFYFIGQGIGFTLQVFFYSLSFGLFFGVLLSLLYYKNLGRFFIQFISSIARGLPVILQLSIVYFALPQLGITLGIISSATVVLGFNSAIYIAEILRAGIESIPKGQFEAAKTLGISPFYTWKGIIFPQVLKNILPAINNQSIILLKDTSLISVIGGLDITRYAQIIAAQQFSYFGPMIIAGLYYYFMVIIFDYIGKQIEKRL